MSGSYGAACILLGLDDAGEWESVEVIGGFDILLKTDGMTPSERRQALDDVKDRARKLKQDLYADNPILYLTNGQLNGTD